MKKKKFKIIKQKVWLYPGMAGWHFVSIDKKQSKEIKELWGKNVRGFGSIPIEVTVGKTSWKTSIFPDKKSGTYLLPIKASVRKAEDIEAEDYLTYTIEIKNKK